MAEISYNNRHQGDFFTGELNSPSGSQSKCGQTIASLKQPYQKDVQGVGSLHPGGQQVFGDRLELDRSRGPYQPMAGWQDEDHACTGHRDQGSQGPATGQCRVRSGHRRALIGVPDICFIPRLNLLSIQPSMIQADCAWRNIGNNSHNNQIS